MLTFLSLSLCFVLVSVSVQQQTTSTNIVSVTLPSGHTVRGVREDVYGFPSTVQIFKGLPYAKPPLGELRLKPPQEPEPRMVNATSWRASCQQSKGSDFNEWSEEIKSAGLSEDCLFLNVWVPDLATTGEVMVWIHGGGYVTGSGSKHDSRFLATIGRVIVVTINYRLGVFGFLPTGGTEGTLGLQDQVMALKWVKKNIASFGGDPNRVTIFGGSAGATSVSLLTRSPKAKGLFQRAISQSGVAGSPWALIRPENREQELKNIEDIFRDDIQCYQSAVECAMSATTDQLVALTAKIVITPPTVDHDFVTAAWNDIRTTHQGLELMIGTNPEETAYIVNMACSNVYTTSCDQDKGLNIFELVDWDLAPPIDMDSVRNLIHAYNQWFPMYVNDNGNANMMAATYLGTDTQFQVPTNRTASELSQAGYRVYVYMMDLIPSMITRTPWSTKAEHADDVPFVFARSSGKETAEEKVQQAQVVQLWTDFARRKPAEYWLPFGSRGEYLHISTQNPSGYSTEPYLPEERDWFWRQYYSYGIFPPLGTTDGARRAVAGLTLLIAAGFTLLFFR